MVKMGFYHYSKYRIAYQNNSGNYDAMRYSALVL